MAALGALLLFLASSAHGDDAGPYYPARISAGSATLVDGCGPFADLPRLHGRALARAPFPSLRDPAARATPAVWTEYRSPQQPLRGTGNNWIFVPFDGCAGIDTGDVDLRNPSGEEAVRGARFVAIGFRPPDAPCASGAPTIRCPGVASAIGHYFLWHR